MANCCRGCRCLCCLFTLFTATVDALLRPPVAMSYALLMLTYAALYFHATYDFSPYRADFADVADAFFFDRARRAHAC